MTLYVDESLTVTANESPSVFVNETLTVIEGDGMTTDVREGVQLQNKNEEKTWIIDVGNKTSSPTSTSVVEVIDTTTGEDVKATVMPSGSTSVNSSSITLPILKLLEPGRLYNVFVKWTDSAEIREVILQVKCRRRNN